MVSNLQAEFLSRGPPTLRTHEVRSYRWWQSTVVSANYEASEVVTRGEKGKGRISDGNGLDEKEATDRGLLPRWRASACVGWFAGTVWVVIHRSLGSNSPAFQVVGSRDAGQTRLRLQRRIFAGCTGQIRSSLEEAQMNLWM